MFSKQLLRKISGLLIPLACMSYALPYLYYFLINIRDGDIYFLDWKKTQYFINYFEYGFIKRGLIGNIFVFVPAAQIKYWIVTFHTILFLALLFLFARITDHKKYDRSAWKSLDWLRAFFIFSPFLVLQAGYDVGRYDLLNLLFLMLSMVFVHRGYYYPTLLLTTLGLLNHEAYLFYGVPIVTALMAQKLEITNTSVAGMFRYKLPFILHVVGALLTALLIYAFGNKKQKLDSALGLGQQVWSRDLWEPSLGASTAQTILLGIVLTSIFLWLVALYAVNKKKPDFLILGAVVPLALFFLGVDYARWCGLIFFVTCVITIHKITIEQWRLNHWTLSTLGLLFLLPLGPIGIETLFPFWAQILPILKAILARLL